MLCVVVRLMCVFSKFFGSGVSVDSRLLLFLCSCCLVSCLIFCLICLNSSGWGRVGIGKGCCNGVRKVVSNWLLNLLVKYVVLSCCWIVLFV